MFPKYPIITCLMTVTGLGHHHLGNALDDNEMLIEGIMMRMILYTVLPVLVVQ